MPDHEDWFFSEYNYMTYEYNDFTCETFGSADVCTMDGTKGAGFLDYFEGEHELHELGTDKGFHALNCPQCGCSGMGGNNFININ